MLMPDSYRPPPAPHHVRPIIAIDRRTLPSKESTMALLIVSFIVIAPLLLLLADISRPGRHSGEDKFAGQALDRPRPVTMHAPPPPAPRSVRPSGSSITAPNVMHMQATEMAPQLTASASTMNWPNSRPVRTLRPTGGRRDYFGDGLIAAPNSRHAI
jgi:hypothetical protein